MNTTCTQNMKASNLAYISPLDLYFSRCEKKSQEKLFKTQSGKSNTSFPLKFTHFPYSPFWNYASLNRRTFIKQEGKSSLPKPARSPPLTHRRFRVTTPCCNLTTISTRYSTRLSHLPAVFPVLPLRHHLSCSTEPVRSQWLELSNLKVTPQRQKPQSCQKKLSLSCTHRYLTLDTSNMWVVLFKCRVYSFWEAKNR